MEKVYQTHSDEKQATSNCDLLKSIDNILYLVPQRYIGKLNRRSFVSESVEVTSTSFISLLYR